VTVLLVEDEVAVRDATERILAANGYSVLLAANAAEGRAVFQRAGSSVKLLVTDVIMPGETGPKLAADLLALNPDLKVLYFSGFAGDELDAQGVGKGNAPFLVKPFTSSDLIDRVRQALAGPPARPPAPG
jgi:DNA-binding NtrC family response regulator